ncbi:patatin-like phospholipase family protein [Shewanella sp. GXUN23E]|uniref:patatin-like phospholipase family protein n=1 Tax=Shewanella sp. GXUN23E TaxID=3422498 RepID=UPI003D7E0AC1
MSTFLKYQHSDSLNRVRQGTALIAEGGGQKGIFTAGVLDSWLELGFNPFSLMIGSSAGAQNLSSFLSGQEGFARRSIMQLTCDKQFYNPKRALLGGNTVDLDWYFHQTSLQDYRLNVEKGAQALSDREFLITATRMQDIQPCFRQPDESNWLSLLKASSALPFLYRHGVEIEGQHYLDGGLAAPLPVEEAYHRGARRIVIIRTAPATTQFSTPWLHRLNDWLEHHNKTVPMVEYLAHHEAVYRRSLHFVENPPADLQIVQISPKRPLSSRLIGSEIKSLRYDYLSGMAVGRRALLGGELNFVLNQTAQSYQNWATPSAAPVASAN